MYTYFQGEFQDMSTERVKKISLEIAEVFDNHKVTSEELFEVFVNFIVISGLMLRCKHAK